MFFKILLHGEFVKTMRQRPLFLRVTQVNQGRGVIVPYPQEGVDGNQRRDGQACGQDDTEQTSKFVCAVDTRAFQGRVGYPLDELHNQENIQRAAAKERGYGQGLQRTVQPTPF